ncbi:hypothetical protein EJ02DRAFT_427931 [Clathrospora elynae]|uniref:Probable double zinc ribbon domain-containing protein n=1 Tax=Clathrospora elynae TaxID=706981 RepID=A0A6A5S5R8_9PLEO|nr:hypothetical protein EJ02DRAFT_427931 [Clathrospora elynae]
MATDSSLLGRIRALLRLPSRLDRIRTTILEAERSMPNRIGTWKCSSCGHSNYMYHEPAPALYPLGSLSCRGCASAWHYMNTAKITSPTVHVRFHHVQSTILGAAMVLPMPQNLASSYGYICLAVGCGLTWQTEIKTEWLSGRRRRVLLLSGNRGKCHCACGMKIFGAGDYAVFEVVPRSSVVLGVVADATAVDNAHGDSMVGCAKDTVVGRAVKADERVEDGRRKRWTMD